MNNNNTKNYHSSVAFMIGALAGGVAALLLAPQTGAELRGRIRTRAGELKDTTRDKTHSVTGAVRGAISEAKHTYRDELDKRRPVETDNVARRTGA
jgi:gas vesicle protein